MSRPITDRLQDRLWMMRAQRLALDMPNASWGDPLLWPAALLGTPHPMAPTSLSKARVFSQQIGGRSNQELLSALANHGIRAQCHAVHALLSPLDHACGSVLILWQGDPRNTGR